MVSRCLTAIGVAAIAGTEISTKLTIGGIGDHLLAGAHITELGTAAEDFHMTAGNGGAEVARHGLSGVETTGIELLDVGILNLPYDVARVIGTIVFTNTFLSGTAYSAEAATVDVALSIVCEISDTNIG